MRFYYFFLSFFFVPLFSPKSLCVDAKQLYARIYTQSNVFCISFRFFKTEMQSINWRSPFRVIEDVVDYVIDYRFFLSLVISLPLLLLFIVLSAFLMNEIHSSETNWRNKKKKDRRTQRKKIHIVKANKRCDNFTRNCLVRMFACFVLDFLVAVRKVFCTKDWRVFEEREI